MIACHTEVTAQGAEVVTVFVQASLQGLIAEIKRIVEFLNASERITKYHPHVACPAIGKKVLKFKPPWLDFFAANSLPVKVDLDIAGCGNAAVDTLRRKTGEIGVEAIQLGKADAPQIDTIAELA